MLTVRRQAAAGLVCLTALAAAPGCAGGRSPGPADPAPAWAGVADTSGMTRVRFARGTTSGILNDSLPAGGERAYLLGALQGQVMLAHAIPWSDRRGKAGGTVVRVFRPDGAELTAPGGAGSLWTGRLPVSGDYVVRVRAPGAPVSYTLAVQIPRRVVVDRENPSTSFAGVAPSRAPVDYLIKGQRGQSLDVELRGEDPGTHLHVYGLDDGVQLAPLADRLRRYRGALPASQDYVISVVPASEGQRYDLMVTMR